MKGLLHSAVTGEDCARCLAILANVVAGADLAMAALMAASIDSDA